MKHEKSNLECTRAHFHWEECIICKHCRGHFRIQELATECAANKKKKTGCCPESYLGLPEHLLEQAIADRILENGQIIPCLHCRSIYKIENNSLVYLGELSIEEAYAAIKMFGEELLKKVYETKKEVKDIDKDFMKGLGIKW